MTPKVGGRQGKASDLAVKKSRLASRCPIPWRGQLNGQQVTFPQITWMGHLGRGNEWEGTSLFSQRVQLWYTKTLMTQWTLLCPGEDEFSSWCCCRCPCCLAPDGGFFLVWLLPNPCLHVIGVPLPIEGLVRLLCPLLVNTHLFQVEEGRLPLLSACYLSFTSSCSNGGSIQESQHPNCRECRGDSRKKLTEGWKLFSHHNEKVETTQKSHQLMDGRIKCDISIE